MADRLVIAAFKWGHKYTTEHAVRLRNAFRRNLTLPHDFVLISDRPDTEDSSLDVLDLRNEIWTKTANTRCMGQKLAVYNAAMRDVLGSRFVLSDLDNVIVGNCDALFDRPDDFVIAATPQGPLYYNSSLTLMTAGARRKVYDDWTPAKYNKHGLALSRRSGVPHGCISDEGWVMAWLGPGEKTWTKADGVYYYRRHIAPSGGLPTGAKVVIMNGKQWDPAKPRWQEKSPWIREHWR